MNSKVVRIIGALGALFNLEGVHAYLRHAGVVGAAAPAEAGPAMPAFVTAAFAIAVFAGVIGSIGLLLLKSWARPVLWLAFVATLVNWGWVFAYSPAASLPLGVAVIVVQLILVVVAERSRRAA